MPRFLSVQDAYEWAALTLDVRRNGRTNMPDPDRVAGGAGKDYAYLDAITIWARVEACDPTDDRRPSWLALYLLPDPMAPKPEWTEREITVLTNAMRELECLLHKAGYLYGCANPRRGCRMLLTGS